MKQCLASFKFAEHVASTFGFLSQYGFSCVSASLIEVRYESNRVHLQILMGKLDGEVSISFGRIGKKEEFSFTLFLRLVNPALEKRLGERLVGRPDQVRDCLAKVAAALLDEGQQIIKGDDRIFEQMKDVRWWDFQPDALKTNR